MPLEFMAIMATPCFVTGIPSFLVGFVIKDEALFSYGVVTTAVGTALVVSPFVFRFLAALMGVY